jgi:phage/plasmid-associated DNA primase
MTYKDEADVIAHWITECGLEFAPDGVCLIGELYASYAGFTKAGGNVPLSTISFVKRLVAKYPTKVQKKVLADNKRGIKGLRFRE